VDQPHERTSAGDPSENSRACRGAAAVEEVVAERGYATASEQCCSGGHHVHLELEELLRSQGWRHRQRLVGTLVVLPLLARTSAGAPGVHHLFAAERNL
jgi:hypothetical protein